MWNNGADYCYDQIIFASSHVNINGTTTVHADHMIFSGGCAHVSNQASLLYDTRSGSNCGNANGYFGPGDCQLAALPIEDITNLKVLKTQNYSVISFTTIGVTDDVDYYTVHFEKEMDYKVDFKICDDGSDLAREYKVIILDILPDDQLLTIKAWNTDSELIFESQKFN